MSALFETWNETFAIDDIASTQEAQQAPAPQVTMWLVRFRDVRKEPRRITGAEHARLMRQPLQLIPAVPGTDAVRVWVENGVGEILRTPVIAWALCVDGAVRHVTATGVNDGSGLCDREISQYVQSPGGRIEGVGEQCDPVWFDDEAEMIAYFVEQRRAGTAS